MQEERWSKRGGAQQRCNFSHRLANSGVCWPDLLPAITSKLEKGHLLPDVAAGRGRSSRVASIDVCLFEDMFNDEGPAVPSSFLISLATAQFATLFTIVVWTIFISTHL